jgi:uncharacterized membrane protein YdjX (TVP38/TMEM64 family)
VTEPTPYHSEHSEEPSVTPASDDGGRPEALPPAKKISTADKVKFAGLVFFFLIIITISIQAVQFVQNLGEGSIEVQLENAIKQAGVFGILICLALQFIQIVVAFIPGEVVQVAIGYVYGTVGGGFITLFGALISSIFVFYLVRKLGAPFVQAMTGDKDSKINRFLQNSKSLNSLVFILYLIPGLPKDLLTYLVPLTTMKPSYFFVLSTIARTPAIFASTFVAASFKSGNYVGMAIVAIIFGGLGVLGIVFNQRIMELIDKAMARFGSHKDAKPSPDKETDGQ